MSAKVSRSVLRSWIPWVFVLALPLGGCQGLAVPPYVEKHYVSVGVSAVGQNVEADVNENDFPYPGLDLTGGTIFHLNDNLGATSVEASLQVLDFGQGGDLDGTLYRASTGLRQWFGMERRLRPSLSAGLSWTDLRMQDISDRFDVRGLGFYVGGGLDYFLTDRIALGTTLRVHMIFSETDEESDFVTSADGGLRLLYRF